MREGEHDRVGARLRDARERRGISRQDAASRVGISRRMLAAYERGRPVPDALLATLARTYGISACDVVPPRRASRLEVSGSHLAAGETSRSLPPDADDEAVLREYLELVREMRGLGEEREIVLRHADVDALAASLGDTPDEIERRLVALIACTREEARTIQRALLKRRLVAPAAGFVLGVGGLTPALAAGGAETPKAPDAVEVVERSVPTVPTVPEVAPAVTGNDDGESDETPDPAPADDGTDGNSSDGSTPSGDDWAEIIDPLVIER